MARTSNAEDRIIAALAKGPQTSVQAIANLVGLTRQNCTAHVRRLVQRGVVSRGYSLVRAPTAYTLIGKPRPDCTDDDVEAALQAAECVSSYHAITSGRYNYIVHVGTGVASPAFRNFVKEMQRIVLETETFAHIGQ